MKPTPTSTYKMSKTLKMRLSSTMYGKDLLPLWKRAMMDAEISSVQTTKILNKREKDSEKEID